MENGFEECYRGNNLEKELTDIKGRVKVLECDMSNIKQVSAARDEQYKFITDTVKDIKDSIKDILKEVKDLKSEPGKKWDKLQFFIISCIIGGIIGYFFTKI